ECASDQFVGSDPQDVTRVSIGFQELFLPTDGGGSFPLPAVSSKQLHWDFHAITFTPRTHAASGPPTRVWVGEDGGVGTSADGNTWQNVNETIATNLLHSIAIGRGTATNPRYSSSGAPHTGTTQPPPPYPATH